MIWNIHFQIAGLILTLVCAESCLKRKRLSFRAEKAFVRMLTSVIFCTFFDLISILAINYRESVNGILVEFFSEMYLFFVVLCGYFASQYAMEEIQKKFGKWATGFSLLPVVIQAIVSTVFHVQIYSEETTKALYTYGLPVYVTYISSFLYITSVIMVSVLFKDEIAKNKRTVLFMSSLTWFIAALIQYFNNEILIVTYAMSVTCIYIYCKLENPENRLDETYNVFNRKGFTIVLDEMLRSEKKTPVIAFAVQNINAIREIFGYDTAESLFKEICSYVKSIDKLTLFKIDTGTFTILVGDEGASEDVLIKLQTRFENPWEVNDVQIVAKTCFIVIPDISINSTGKKVVETIKNYVLDAKRDNETFITIDDTELKRRKRVLEVQNALEWALSNNGVEMYYQPIYAIEKGHFASMEALVRIRDEKGNLIMPGEFVEIAERDGKILELGETIFRKVCEFMMHNPIERYGIDYIEVNLSVVQCMQDDLADTFKDIMAEYQISPYKVNLEITETAAINSKDTLEKNMDALFKYGSTFSLDDYGSGYSNLNYIVDMPLKIIKIDRSLAIEYEKSKKAKVALEYTIEMIHRLGMEIVVEGIETIEQYQLFKDLGVEFIQGYYFSKPLPQAEVLNFVKGWL